MPIRHLMRVDLRAPLSPMMSAHLRRTQLEVDAVKAEDPSVGLDQTPGFKNRLPGIGIRLCLSVRDCRHAKVCRSPCVCWVRVMRGHVLTRLVHRSRLNSTRGARVPVRRTA